MGQGVGTGAVHIPETATDAVASVPPSTPPDAIPAVDDTSPTDLIDAPAAPIPAIPPSQPPARRRPLALDMTLLAVVGLFLLAALGAGVATMYQQFYSPTAFVLRYIGELADGHAADALTIPGVAVDSSELEAAGLPLHASDALLRSSALGSLTDVRIVSTTQQAGQTLVTVAYRAGGHAGSTQFAVEPAGWIGVAPAWRFARSPLAVINLHVHGSMQFDVNGFQVDKRQVSDAAATNPEATVPLLVFSPGLYSVTVDTAISQSPGVAVLSNTPMKSTPIDIHAHATKQFEKAVQTKVHEFLTACAQQRVLQPTGCPFGYVEENRILAPPTWSMVKQPTITLAPDGSGWRIQTTPATAHIRVDVRSIFDGTVRHLNEDVPFLMTGAVTVGPDGAAAISVTGLNPE